jgi:hypothetical protein
MVFLFLFIWRPIELRISTYQKFAELRPRFRRTFQQKCSQQNALWERSRVDNSFRYIFIYRFSYLHTYYSFLADYNKKCFDINWFHLLSPAIWNKIFIQPRGKYFTYINQKCYFLLWLFQLRWTLIQHFQVFQKSCDLKVRIPQRQDGGTK